jgi:hypothetical protein
MPLAVLVDVVAQRAIEAQALVGEVPGAEARAVLRLLPLHRVGVAVWERLAERVAGVRHGRLLPRPSAAPGAAPAVSGVPRRWGPPLRSGA